jgi:pyruvate,orthophosphate dikinase
MGICGEHGGEPRSIEFCHQIGLDYVSCFPIASPLPNVLRRLRCENKAVYH